MKGTVYEIRLRNEYGIARRKLMQHLFAQCVALPTDVNTKHLAAFVHGLSQKELENYHDFRVIATKDVRHFRNAYSSFFLLEPYRYVKGIGSMAVIIVREDHPGRQYQ